MFQVWAAVITLGLFYTKIVVRIVRFKVFFLLLLSTQISLLPKVVDAVKKLMDPPISTQTRLVQYLIFNIFMHFASLSLFVCPGS